MGTCQGLKVRGMVKINLVGVYQRIYSTRPFYSRQMFSSPEKAKRENKYWLW